MNKNVHTEALLIIAKSNNIHIHWQWKRQVHCGKFNMMENYTAIKKGAIVPHTITWMTLYSRLYTLWFYFVKVKNKQN